MSWLADASANKIVKSYIQDFVDVSGNFKVRAGMTPDVEPENPAWSAYGQELTGLNESDNQVSFGMSCDMNASGTTIVVGAIDEDGAGSGTNDGVARVYTYNSATSLWIQLGNTISESNGSDFGYHTSINDAGDRILVVDPGSNYARIYDYNSGTNTWDNIGTLSQYPLYAFIGHMSGDGNTVMIGDHTSTSSAGANSGNDYIYRYDGSTWNLIGTFIGTAASDYAGPGATLSYDGNRFIHGVQNDDSNGLSNNGRATVYDYSGSGTAWNQVGSHLYGDVNSGRFGGATDMSLDGSIIAIGAYYANYVKVYEYSDDTNDWVQIGSTLIGPTGTSVDDYYGASLCISHDGNTLVVNERDNDDGATDGGAIFVYTYTNGDWVQKGTTLTSTYSGAKLGYMHNISLAVSGDGSKIVAGGYGADANGTDSGYVQAFQWPLATPGSEIIPLDVSGGIVTFFQGGTDPVDAVPYSTTQLGQDLVGAIGDGMGTDVAMNEDGTIMVVGALGVKANNGSSLTGAAYVYEDVNGTWTLKGSEIKPFPTATTDRRFGESVGINNTGNTIVVGALSGAYNYSSSDRASISAWEYSEVTSDWVQKGSMLYADAVLDDFSMVAINKTGDMIAGSAPRGGYVRVYQYTNNDWTQIGNFSISSFTGYAGRYRGSITFCDDIPGRFAFGDAGSGDSVQVHDYDFDNSTWTQVGSTITVTMASANIEDGGFGSSVSFSKDGTLLAVGAIDGGLDGTEDGDARVFQYNSGTSAWEQLGDTLHKDDDRGEGAHGCIVKLDHTGTLLAVANYFYEPGGSLNRAGAIFIYKYRNGAWDEVILQQHTDNTLQYWGDGMTLSKDGTRFAGSTTNGDVNGKNDGIARAFTITGNEATLGTTVQTMKIEDGTVDISGTTWINQGQSGASIASSNQGAFIVESAGTSSSNAVVYVETAGQTEAFSIRENGDLYSANALQHSSDDRRKTNEQYITNATETIKKLSPQIYTKLNDLVQNGGTPTKTESGLIAQEIYYNAPELRHLIHIEDSAGNKLTPQEYDLSGNDIQNDPDYTSLGWGDKSATVDYIGLLAYLIKSNQEQDACIQERQTSIDEQAELIKQYQDRVTALENK